jgi:hypothetical protein
MVPITLGFGQDIKNFRKTELHVGSISLGKQGSFHLLGMTSLYPGNLQGTWIILVMSFSTESNYLDQSYPFVIGEQSLRVLWSPSFKLGSFLRIGSIFQLPDRTRECQELSQERLLGAPQLLRKQSGPSLSITINGLLNCQCLQSVP